METEYIYLSHKIEIAPTDEQIKFINKCIGCARQAYNWGLSYWYSYYAEHNKNISWSQIRKEYNRLKETEFAHAYEVPASVTCNAFRVNLKPAIDNFFRDIEKHKEDKSHKVGKPKFKKKNPRRGSCHLQWGDGFHIEGKRVKIALLKTTIKLKEKLRFDGKINSICISKKNGKFFMTFQLRITKEEYARTHKIPTTDISNNVIGIDLGVSRKAILSNGLIINDLKSLLKLDEKIADFQRHNRNKQFPKSKGDTTPISNNAQKYFVKLGSLYEDKENKTYDLLHKVTTILANFYSMIGVETLDIKSMMSKKNKNSKRSRNLANASLYKLKSLLEYKVNIRGGIVHSIPTKYPSTQTCSRCNNVKDKDEYLTTSDRIYHCDVCDLTMDRDLNASYNILYKMIKELGLVESEFTPVDLLALLDCFERNKIATSKVETGSQEQFSTYRSV